MNDFISMQKDAGLICVLGAVDAIRSAQIYQATTYNFTSYVVAGVLFILMSFPFIRLPTGTPRGSASASRWRPGSMAQPLLGPSSATRAR